MKKAPRPPSESIVDRFLRYVRIDTQAAEGQSSVPSSEGQWTLARMLVDELRALGVADVRISESCMVYAKITGNTPGTTRVPAVGFLAHVDTSPAVTGANVRPVIHANYQGGDIVLPGDPSQVITVAGNPILEQMIGDDIITTDGTTLLGSDDKAGVAAIMTMVDVLSRNPEIPHGPLAIGFTADEEVGIGIDQFDVASFGAAVAYTVDGDAPGEINHESWSARVATITFHGKSAHPGSAKGLMVNAAYAFAHFILHLPAAMRPEATEGREGFVHPYSGLADVETSTLKVLLRDFEIAGLEAQEAMLRELAMATERRFDGVRITVDIREQYRNMNEVLKDYPYLTEHALEAARRAGLTARTRPIRGGTDGSKLTFRGLPCPNIFTGGQNFHSKLEFNSRKNLENTAKTLIELVQIFAEAQREP